ncbi:methylated-DNA--[protein]-cysteine S-methyltransferase [Methanobacterium petrolearium]|uniref:methylated-DNA--[protein]-cysteine S-methyltransferase n=1 Tax=Methanobacterium petrolearium TaxID=710190 RepID=UPI001AE953D1|nr:MGMT family protein [Methanobacterium petrolearium]MBP1946810.1 methylated-DNA-[protein]-cysteine S-methyltransferase [Methanobacterium petrolearium]BDZ69783.1 hypothetical protein GCM10025861_03000 [Methanobacterium petrolearium]
MKIKLLKKTSFGPVAVVWSISNDSPRIYHILLSKPEVDAEDQAFNIYPNLQVSSSEEIERVATAIKSFLEGEDIIFSLENVALEQCSSFQTFVLLAEYQIPRGSISTYQFIARHLGVEKGARAVGNALATNPFPIIIPCHRAIRSDGTIGGFQGGIGMKRALLEAEEINFDSNGCVMSPRFSYK